MLDAVSACELGIGNEAQLLATAPIEGRNDQLARASEMVERIARQLATRLPTCVEIDDLLQSGMIGLIEASRSYDASLGASFQTYASFRIRGAMLDELRKSDWVPRSVRRRLRAVSEAARIAEQKAGRATRSREVAAVMDMPVDELARLLADAARGHILSLDENSEDENSAPLDFTDLAASPHDHLSDYEIRRALVAAIDQLPDRERRVLWMHYKQELDIRQIGVILERSESRICQIHRRALGCLRARLREWIQSPR